MTGRKEKRNRRSAKGETPVEEVKIQLTPEPQAVDFLKVPGRGDSPRDFRSLHREKSPFEIGEKPDVQVASQKAIIDKALIMDISGGVTNVDEYISLFFTDSCSLDPASCGDISTVKIEIVEEDTSAPDAPKPASEHEKTVTEAEAELEAKRIEEEGKLAAIQEAQGEPEPAPEPEPIPEPPPAEPEESEEESEEEEEVVPPREPTPPPPPPPKSPTPEPIKKSPTPEYDSDVELIPPKEDFDPSLWKSVDDIEKQLVDSEGGTKKPKSKEASRRESTHEMTERERDLEWQRQRQLMRPPLVISHLKSRAAPKGSTVKLTCTISGPGITVRWFKDGDPVEKNPRHTFKVSEGLLSLEIKDIEFSDAGEYSCIIKNKNGETSTSTSVQVYENIESKPIPPTFISIKETYSLHSDEIILECRVRGSPRPNIAWIKDGEYIIPGDKYEQYDHADGTCKLIITKPGETDSGTYTCEAESGGCSDAISHNVQFVGKEQIMLERTHSVYHRNPNLPHFYTPLADYSIPSGGNICLVVEVQGNCEVQWFKDRYEVKGRPPKVRFYSDGTGVFALCISAATMDASGRYVCRASNNFGKAESSSNVDVINPNAVKGAKPPIFMARPQPDIKIRQGQEISMAFKVIGDPKPKIQWMKGTKDITNAARTVKEVHDEFIRFSIKEALTTDEGAYFIVARNRYGIDRCLTTVTVKHPKGYKKGKEIEESVAEPDKTDKGRM
uniref:Putative neural cell adhesion molecule l1 n=1 Tax=Culex tarsalis TaxID=7177 RepID=A0A1Q3G571_CULTA